ncbi:MAG: nuclear transport factor 2 family protein [Saprospirales bacterium]|nr:MAG: nuclear transport factor 2 family protein [Saprospirales bacterium]
MKNYLLSFWFVISLSGFTFTQSITYNQDSQLLIELHQKKFDFMIALELDSLRPLLHPELQYIHSNGWIEDKKEVLDNLKSGYLTYNALDYKEAEVRFFGETAIITGLAEFNVALEGRQIVLDLLYSETWYKSDYGWQLIHRHACRPLE